MLVHRLADDVLHDTRLVFSDSIETDDLAPELKLRNISYFSAPYAGLGTSATERRQALSAHLLQQFRLHQVSFCFCFGDHLLEDPLLKEFAHRIINLHPSLLPAFPGRHAIDQAEAAGAKLMGNTAHFIDAGVDTGPIIMQCVIPAERFQQGGYDAILDTQITMVGQIHRWLKSNRLRVEGPQVIIDGATGGPEAFYPPLELTTTRSEVMQPRILHVGRPNIGNRANFLRRVNEMLDRRWFTNDGPLVREFEGKVAAFIGVKHCVAMCNATVALEVSARALGLSGEIIVPAFTFAASAHAMEWVGLKVRFADIDPDTHSIDPVHAESLISERTSAIMGVHVWGRACATDQLGVIASRHGIKLIYDACHAFGCSNQGQLIGAGGSCEVFSFHATKFLNSFEGGAVCTNDDALAAELKLARNFGFAGVDKVTRLGINGKMTEVCAAMGLTSLESITDLIRINRLNYETYQELLSGITGVALYQYPAEEQNNFQYVVISLEPGIRDRVVDALRAANVLARKYFWPGCHHLEPYRSRPEGLPRLPVADDVASRVLTLPTGQNVGRADIARVVQVIRQTLA
jgi:dTDP-4-amino-4,6-dideoxygalactose transaminase/folate-dependent phosphoribosylglycinamide formyltransferase PurN